jgi:hypothetical protein
VEETVTFLPEAVETHSVPAQLEGRITVAEEKRPCEDVSVNSCEEVVDR